MKKIKYLFRKKNRIKKTLLLFSISLMTAAVIFFFYQRFVFAATCNWQSTGSSSWNTIGNWSCGHVPTSTDDVYFTNSYPADVSLDADVNVQSINIGSSYPGNFNQNNHQITVGSGGFSLSMGNFVGSTAPMTVNGNMTISGGTFTQPTLPFDTTSGLTAYWNMDESSGTTTVADSSGNGITGTSSSSTNVTAGKIGNARSFDGTQYVSFSDNVGLGSTSMTVAAWVYPTAFVANAPIYNRRTTGGIGGVTMELNGTGGSVYCYFYISGAWRSASTSQILSLNTWNHVSCTYDGSTIKPYINGVLDSNTTAYVGGINNPSSPNVEIGRNISNNTYKWQGNIDEVRIYNRALDNKSVGVLAQNAISLSINGNYAQSGGTFTGSSHVMDINGNFSLSGGFFTAPSGNLTVERSFTISNPSAFSHNNGTVVFDGKIVGVTHTIDAPGVTFNTPVIFNRNITTWIGSVDTYLIVTSGTTLPLGNNPTFYVNYTGYRYDFTNNGTITVGTGALTSTVSGTFINNGTINLSSATAWNMNGNFTNNADLNASTLTSWPISGGTLTNNSGKTITATGLTSWSTANITNNGTINTSSCTAYNINGTLTNNSGATFTTGTGPTFNVAGGFVISSTSTFPTTNVNLNLNGSLVGSSYTIDAPGVTFNAPVVFNRNITTWIGSVDTYLTIASGTTIPLGNNPTFYVNYTGYRYDFTNNGTITVGTGTLTATVSGTFTNSGTITLSSTTAVNISGTFVNNNNVTASSVTSWSSTNTTNSGTINTSSCTAYNINGTLTNNSGATFTTGTGPTFNVAGGFVISSTSTFPTTNVTLNLNGGIVADTTVNAPSVTFNTPVTINRNYNWNYVTLTLTIASGTTIPLGNNPTITLIYQGGHNLVNNGTITVGTGTLTTNINGSFTNNGTINLSSAGLWTLNHTFTNNAGATLTATSSTGLTFNNNFTVNALSSFPASLGTLTINGTSGTQTYTNSLTNSYTGFVKNGASTLSLSQGFTSGDFTFSAGIISNPASSYNININGNFNQSSSGTLGGANLPINFTGTNSQIATQSAGTFSSPFTVNKSGGALSLGSNFSPSSTCTVTAGTFDLNGNNFTCGSTFTVNNGGTLRMVGSESPTTPVLNSGSTVEYKGNANGLADTYGIKNWNFANLLINMIESQDSLTPSVNTLLSGLTNYWPMDETSGTAVADTLGGNNATAYGGAAITSGKFGNARNFVNASSQYLLTSGNIGISGASPRTVSFWFKPSSLDGWGQLFAFGTRSSSQLFSIGYDYSGIVDEGIFFNGWYNDPGGHNFTIIRNAWNYVAVTYNGSVLNVYINGNSTPDLSSTTSLNTGINTLYIGQRGDGNYFDGIIDDFRIYNRVLTSGEIASLAGGNQTNPTTISSLSVSNNLTISSGTFVSPHTLTIGGNFTNNGTFTHNNGTVVFNDASKTSVISGSGSPAVTFYNLSSTTPGKTLQFTNGETFRINGLFTLTGTSSNKINLSSTTPSQWLIDHQGTEAVTNAIITNSGCAAGTTEISLDTTNTNGGNDGACWAFVPPNSPRLKGGARLKGGVRLK